MLKILSDAQINDIIERAANLLGKYGIFIEYEPAGSLLLENGAKKQKKRIIIPSSLIEKSLKTVPDSIDLYDRNGLNAITLSGKTVVFNPGSSGIFVLDYNKKTIRDATAADFVNFSIIAENMTYIKAQSTSMVCADVPKEISDIYRMYVALTCNKKPLISGIFQKENQLPTIEMLTAVRGTAEALRKKPLAVFDCCPTSPLTWSELTCFSLMECTKAGIPVSIVPMPLAGATAPVTLYDELIQHTAENLSGIVLAQLTNPGTPVVYGGSPTIFDMQSGSTPMGSAEAMLLAAAYNQIGKKFGIPAHGYLGLSDAKLLDYQAGFESAAGFTLAVMSGINIVSGAGMHFFQQSLSNEKLVIDNDICGMAYRMQNGFTQSGITDALDIFSNLEEGESLLTHEYTLTNFKREQFFPGKVIDRAINPNGSGTGKDATQRAHEEAERILQNKIDHPLIEDVIHAEMIDILKHCLPKDSSKSFREVSHCLKD